MKRDRSAVIFSLILGASGLYTLLSGILGWPSFSFGSRVFAVSNQIVGVESYFIGGLLLALGVWLFTQA